MTLVSDAPERRSGLFEIRLRTIQPTKAGITKYKRDSDWSIFLEDRCDDGQGGELASPYIGLHG